MRILFISSIFVLFFNFAAFSQTNENLPCPTIKVTSPTSITIAGETMTFTANVRGNNNSSVTYNWTVSDGTIIEGLGTSVIKVATNSDMAGNFISATVSLKGFPANCKNSASEKAAIAYKNADPIVADEYAKLSFKDEKARLENIAFQLKGNKNDKACFVIYITEKDKIESVKYRISKIKNYFAEKHKISKARIVIITSKADFNRTRIYLVPPSVTFPDTGN